MKKNNILFFGLIWITCCLIGVSSCSPDYETEFEVKTLVVPDADLAPINFSLDGGQKEIRVQTNVPVENWIARSNADWCKIEKEPGKVIISADENEMYVTRVACVTIAYGYQSYDISVTQKGKEPVLLIEGKREGLIKEIAAKGGELSVKVTSNLELDYISIPDTASWVHWESTSGTSEEKILKFLVDPSLESVTRYCTVTLQSSQNFDYVGSFIIKQERRNYVLVPLTVDMLSANATEVGDGHGLPGLIDGDKNTYYHTLWSGPSPGMKPHYVQINLEQPLQFLRFEYDGRMGNNSGDVKRAGIWVSETGEDDDSDWSKAATITFSLRNETGGHYVQNEGVTDLGKPYRFIRFIPEARRSADPIPISQTNSWWNMANLYIYTFDD